MSPPRRTALIAGVLYLLTFISIPTIALYSPARDPNYVLGTGPDLPVILGSLLEMVVALAGIGTSVVLYPVVKRYGEARAIGLVCFRVLEAAMIYVGIVSMMSMVSLRQSGLGAAALAAGHGLAAQYQWAFFYAQSFIPAVNGVLLGSLLHQSRLVPRWLPTLAFVGAALLIVSWFAILFGHIQARGLVAAVAALPIAAWEFSLGLYLAVWGFRPSSIKAVL